MAITVEARTNIIGLVVGMFNAAPGASVLSDLVAAYEAGSTLKQIAANLANTDQFKSIFPTFSTNDEFATKVVNQLLAQASTEAKAEAVTVLTAALNGNMSRSDAFVEAITFVNGTASTNATFGTSAAAFDNKVEVATYYSVEKNLSGSSLANLQSVVVNVDNTAASVTTAKGTINGTVGAGSTYTLTTSQDSLTGNASNEIFKALATQDGNGTLIDTLQNVDSLDGGAGSDQLVVTLSQAATVAPTLKNIETVDVRFAAAATLNLANATGVTSVNVADSTVAGTVSGVSTIAALSVKNQTQNATFSGNTATTLGLTVDAVGKSTALNTITVDDVATTLNVTTNNSYVTSSAVTKVKTLTVDATGKNTLTLTTPTAVTSATVTGTGSLTLTTALDAATKLDASANTGGVTATVDDTATTVTGGSGKDKVTYTAAIAATAKVDLGAGADTLVIAAASAKGAEVKGGADSDTLSVTGAFLDANSKATYTGFEVLEVSNNTAGAIQFDPTLLDGITSYNVKGSTAQVELINLAAAPTVNIVDNANPVADLKLTLKTATGSTDSATLVFDNGATTAANGAVVTKLTADAIETLNIQSNGLISSTGTANTVTLATLTTTKVVITGSQAVSFTTGAHSATLTVDASAATGKTTINGGAAVATFNVSGGTGADTISAGTKGGLITGNAGADAITLAGGTDTVVYKSASDSLIAEKATDGSIDATKLDSVTSFTTGTDKIDLTSLNFSANTQKVVLEKSVAATDAALFTLAKTADFYQDAANIVRGVVAVSNGTDTYLFVDANKDGVFSASTDMVVKLVGLAGAANFDQADVIFG